MACWPACAACLCVCAAAVSTAEEAALRSVQPPGLRLLGFKPASCLKQYHQLKHAVFVYPHEKGLPGSSKAFAALLLGMLAGGGVEGGGGGEEQVRWVAAGRHAS